MFMGKWTVQENLPGEIQEAKFESEEEAFEYAFQRLSAPDPPASGSLTIIDPQQGETLFTQKSASNGRARHQAAG